MSTTKSERKTPAPRRPEKKFGPFHGGSGLAIWINEVEGASGPRFYRCVTINPRRYRDPKSGEWRDAASLRTSDLPALILALEAAHHFMTTTPLPGEAVDEEAIDAVENGDEIPM